LHDVLSIGGEPSAPDPADALARTLDANELVLAINQLTEDQRQVIALKFVEGYENTEIATMLGKKEGAIRALQYRALRSLQVILEAEEVKRLEFGLGIADAAVG
jgi:RNA polymerase sigma-70 factor (ECF subfamily)